MITHADYKHALQLFQSQRLRRDLADLAAEDQYRQLGQFFFEEMYGRATSVRDEQPQRVHQFIHRTPGVTVHDVEPVLALLQLSNNTTVTRLDRLGASLDFDETTYEQAYHLADNYAERRTQLDLVVVALGNVHRLGCEPLLGFTLKRSHMLAEAVGMADNHRFLLLGYQAIQSGRDMARFLDTVYTREKQRLGQIHKDTAHKQDRFYEIDLPALVEVGDPEAFLSFYAFFHCSALEPGPVSLDALLKESAAYARGVGESLKSQVYDALKELAQGFLDERGNALATDLATLKQIYDHSLIVLYRLLFILYAEARELLPLRESGAYLH